MKDEIQEVCKKLETIENKLREGEKEIGSEISLLEESVKKLDGGSENKERKEAEDIVNRADWKLREEK